MLINTKPKVSIVCVTYGHEKFISEAIDSFLVQKTNFPFEIIVGEDCSPDNSKAIIREYAKTYPNIIIAILRDKNIGALPNFLDLLSMAKGEYIAICDGDDYWTDEQKLQKQVDFLDANLDYTMSCHWVKQIFEDSSEPEKILSPWDYSSKSTKRKNHLAFKDFFPINAVASLSVMYRWCLKSKLPAWMAQHKVGDLPLHLIHADKGKVGVINEVMGVYRKHPAGVWFNHDTHEHKLNNAEDYSKLLANINKELNYKHNDIINPALNFIKTDMKNLKQGHREHKTSFRKKLHSLLKNFIA